MQMPEEAWVRVLPLSWRKQHSSLFLTVTNFFTRAWFAHRLRWMLKDAGSDREAVFTLLRDLEPIGSKPRGDIRTHLASLRTASKGTALDVINDLELLMADIPDSSLSRDWIVICRQMRTDLESGPDAAIAGLHAVRKQILRSGGARLFAIASGSVHAKLAPSVDALVDVLEPLASDKADRPSRPFIAERLRERSPGTSTPVFVGLLAPGMTGGVVILEAPGVRYEDRDKEKLLDYLTSLQFAGGGSHGAFMRTWGAGLAYSNGLSHNLQTGRESYYAERTPEIPQTVKFVVDLIRSAKYDPAMAEYTVAQAFTSAAAGAYEARGEAIAAQLADGIGQERVSGYRKGLLELRASPTLAEDLHARTTRVYGRILPGLGTKLSGVAGGVFFTIGPENQLSAWEQYLKTVEGDSAVLERLYPRDFWLVR